ncbi:hypothetical protein [Nonomuraea solani]|uniref:hypothetical protein n=1 Tax=Nonomuraea solani TaxID=1144553 RepID=UPI0011B0E918|nr:hypothetical protein [Nonomuraea solani]
MGLTAVFAGLSPLTAPPGIAATVTVASPASADDDPVGSAPWAAAEARRTGKRVAATLEQSEVRDVYANPDGLFTAELRITPVRVRRGSDWVPVGTTLRQRADGGVEPGATTVSVTFSGGGDQPLVRFGQDKRRIELRWPAPLPKPVLTGDTATYPEVLPGVDLRMRATAQGFGKVLVVEDRTAAANPKLAELTFDLATEGVKVRGEGHGDFGVYDEKNKLAFGFGAPMAWDSTPANARRAVGGLEIAGSTLVLRPDLKLLTDPATRFPVYIDPFVEAGRTGMAMVLSGQHDQEYWGGDNEKVAKVGYCGWDFCNGIARSSFQYDAAFLAGKHVQQAKFNIFEHYSPSCTRTDVVAFGTDPVSAATTRDNQPYKESEGPQQVQLTTQNVAWGYSASCPGAWVGFDATAAVEKGVKSHNGATAITLRAGNEGDKRDYFLALNCGTHASATARPEAHCRLGTLSMVQLPCTTALMMGRAGTDTFTSTDAACEDKTVVRRLGYLWTSPPQDVTGAPGAVGAELFDSLDRDCEGQEPDRSLGFVITGL